ncbi:MAG: MotA/TolQ/ExbB proton channel family protein [Colwellia sp.]
MLALIELWESVRSFLATGGNVLYFVAIALFLMWMLMVERILFLNREYPAMREDIVSRWNAREDTTSWYAHRIRETWISEMNELLERNMVTIKTLVAMCPLIGLLGTVTGMIGVFEVMAEQGTGNPRLMAAGISMATIPTMSGMVAALSGVFFSSRLDAKVKIAKAKLVDSLPHH